MQLNEALNWLTFAENDYLVAQHLYDDFYPMQCEIICYHCQQCAEKAIKAVYIAAELPGGIPKKHDLSFLLCQMKASVAIPEILFDYADSLTPYGVAVRYPSQIEVSQNDTKAALTHAKAILDWANRLLSHNMQY